MALFTTCEGYLTSANTTNTTHDVQPFENSFTVADGSTYPNAPFRITSVSPQEFMLVTSTNGNVWTVDRGQENTTPQFLPAGTLVANVYTVGSVFNNIACMSANGPRSGLPLSDIDTPGRLYFSTDPGWYIWRDTGEGNWESWGPIFQLNEPNETGLSWVNQGSATTDTTNGGVYLHTPAPGSPGDNVRLRVQDVNFVAPTAPPYTVTAAFLPLLHPVDETSCGLVFRENSTGKFVFFRMLYTTTSSFTKNDLVLSVDQYTNETTFSSNVIQVPASVLLSSVVWLKMQDDGTNLIFSYSNDAANYRVLTVVSRTSFMLTGPDQIGYAVNDTSLLGMAGMTLFSWTKE
jgi:hypothetical protein